jgi:hypothetical protein
LFSWQRYEIKIIPPNKADVFFAYSKGAPEPSVRMPLFIIGLQASVFVIRRGKVMAKGRVCQKRSGFSIFYELWVIFFQKTCTTPAPHTALAGVMRLPLRA